MSTVFLLGAGASAPLGLPTTRGFLRDYKPFGHDKTQLLDAISCFIEQSWNDADIESVMATLDELSQTRVDFLIKIFQKKMAHKISPFTPGEFNVGDSFESPCLPNNIQAGIAKVIERLQKVADQLKSEIKHYILEKLVDFQPSASFDLFFPLFRYIVEKEKRLIIFTTNYDLALERSFLDSSLLIRKEWREIGINDLYMGFEQRVGTFVFDLRINKVLAQNTASIIKLHGSINWHPVGEHVCMTGPIVPADPDEAYLLYPGYKGIPSAGPFYSLHIAFLKVLQEAERLVVIGFSMRDIYIHTIIQHAMILNDKLSIHLFDPNDFPDGSYFYALQNEYPGRIHHVKTALKIDENLFLETFLAEQAIPVLSP